jgi:GT2 family glycosyltransferase
MAIDVSVIVPTFQRPALLAEAVASALSQEGVAVEVLVVDDSAEGSGRETVRALGDARVQYLKREAPSGGNPSLVRQEAWPKAQGRYLAFLDDDDRVAPGGYKELAAALDSDPAAALAFGRVEPFGVKGGELAHELAYFLDAAHRARRTQWSKSRLYLVSELLFGGSLFVSSAVLVRREHLEALGGLDTAAGMMDTTELAVRASRSYQCKFIDKIVAHYRYSADSLIHNPSNAERLKQIYKGMHQRYRREHGALEFAALKVFSRTIKRLL